MAKKPTMKKETSERKDSLGQFFTYNQRVQNVMKDLVKNKTGTTLEPSAGDGALLGLLHKSFPEMKIHGVEYDVSIKNKSGIKITYDDFFHFSEGLEPSYDLIFGNPPYLAYKNVDNVVRENLKELVSGFHAKVNLYHLFIYRAADLLKEKGELIYIVPKEWLYTTSANDLRVHLDGLGSFSHIIDCGEEKLFVDADIPSLMIFRWVKGKRNRNLKFASSLEAALSRKWVEKSLISHNGRWSILSNDLVKLTSSWGTFSDFYEVKVGLVTGLDKAFKVNQKDTFEKKYLQSQVDTTKKPQLFLNLNSIDKESEIPLNILTHLIKHKDLLKGRKISNFNESNWWKYGAIRNEEIMKSKKPRFYALVKTRDAEPFFLAKAKFFTGGVLGIFQKTKSDISIQDAVILLNSSNYRIIFEGYFFTTNDKLSLQPATLNDIPWPRSKEELDRFLSLNL